MSGAEGYTGLDDVNIGDEEMFVVYGDPTDPDYGFETTPAVEAPKMKVAVPIAHPLYAGATPAMRVSERGFPVDQGDI